MRSLGPHRQLSQAETGAEPGPTENRRSVHAAWYQIRYQPPALLPTVNSAFAPEASIEARGECPWGRLRVGDDRRALGTGRTGRRDDGDHFARAAGGAHHSRRHQRVATSPLAVRRARSPFLHRRRGRAEPETKPQTEARGGTTGNDATEADAAASHTTGPVRADHNGTARPHVGAPTRPKPLGAHRQARRGASELGPRRARREARRDRARRPGFGRLVGVSLHPARLRGHRPRSPGDRRRRRLHREHEERLLERLGRRTRPHGRRHAHQLPADGRARSTRRCSQAARKRRPTRRRETASIADRPETWT
jgi:hypothetical protein